MIFYEKADSRAYEGKCDKFEEDDGIEEHNQKMREGREKAKELAKDPEFIEAYRQAMKKAFDKMFDASELTDISDFDLGVPPIDV